jgi:AAA+ superfamily predicted ATPase
MSTSASDWTEANRRHLAAEIARVAALVSGDDSAKPEAPAAVPGRPFRLDVLTERFSLTPFERDLLVMSAGVELDGTFARTVGTPNAALAFERFPNPHWSALAPEGTLRRWRLLEPRGDGPLVQAPLAIDEPLLHWLTGSAGTNSAVSRDAIAIDGSAPLPASYNELTQSLAARLKAGTPTPVFALSGGDRAGRLAVIKAVGDLVGLQPLLVESDALPADPAARATLLRLWERELVLSRIVPVIETRDGHTAAVSQFVDEFDGLLFLVGEIGGTRRGIVRIDLPAIPFEERRALWANALGVAAETDGLDRLAWQFAISPADITHAAAETRLSAGNRPLVDKAWEQARASSRQEVGSFVRRVVSTVTLDDLVLPDAQRRSLEGLGAQVRQQAVVYGAWEMQGKGSRGLGITALFTGPSGTGKTTAAEALAGDLGLDLLHADLSQVVSKYIGETEKNLDRVFAAGEAGGSILLFDEADAIFGKRSEVRDSHDRYANLEISYLLQRMESYRGLAILTTNQKSGIDASFFRRIRFVVHFPFPDRRAREALWRRALPETVLASEPDWAGLSRLSLSGGSIRNIALNAAFYAAEESTKVGAGHLTRAVSTEGAKMEAPDMLLQMARRQS